MSTDKELVLKLKRDDAEAFDLLYWKYHIAVHRNILKILKDEEAADDILQDVFYCLWEKRGSLDPQQSVSGWLFVTSFNKSVSFKRERLKECLAFDTLYNDEQTAESESSELYQSQLGLLQRAIHQLSPQKQKVFNLCKMEGKTYEETAQVLNISKHTVKEYLSCSMLYIKEFIHNHSKSL
ncbi:RNA polymerase sigma factor [Pedobacter sp. SYSU D00535]|uniref:RNA polymerase sigma factor n=1 Tax=Pedobacter sp. SYSU D00535 TaxID=2810308 RepID=UPI001A95860F|nr:sigma-70 family RNA polymerase sigma factor [Pedobacter sp. SYSU D00535]